MYCRKCGNQVDDEAVICPKCGCYTSFPPKPAKKAKSNKGKVTAAKVFAIIGAIVGFPYLFIPTIVGCIAVSKLNTVKNKDDLTGMAICTLLFCNTIAGIIMLCITDEDLR